MWKLDANLNHSQMKKTFFSLALRDQGQALVEFTLIFILLVALSWIPAEFGLAFYTGQMALNASREGARIAAASKTLDTAEITTETCKRLSSAILRDAGSNCAPYSNAKVTVTQDITKSGCPIKVKVEGKYYFRFFQMMRLLPLPTNAIPDDVTITRETIMQWEWATACP